MEPPLTAGASAAFVKNTSGRMLPFQPPRINDIQQLFQALNKDKYSDRTMSDWAPQHLLSNSGEQ